MNSVLTISREHEAFDNTSSDCQATMMHRTPRETCDGATINLQVSTLTHLADERRARPRLLALDGRPRQHLQLQLHLSQMSIREATHQPA